MRSVLAGGFGAVGAVLIGLNILGLTFHPPDRHPAPGMGGVPGYDFASRSISELQGMLGKPMPNFDIERVNTVVFESLVHADDRRIQPQENWIMWLAGLLYEPASKTQSAQRIVSGGKAICSEAVAVLNEISKVNGVDTRMVILNGHVVSEVHTDNGWQVADPDYGVVFSTDLATLESGAMSEVMKDKLSLKGFTQPEIVKYVEIVESGEDNRVLEIGRPSSPRLYAFERLSEWLKWIIPGALVIASAALIRARSSSRD